MADAKVDARLNHWREVFAAMAWHLHGDDMHPGDTLTRLARKATGRRIGISMRCPVRAEWFTTEELDGMRLVNHGRSEPRPTALPIIVIRVRKRHYLIDGQNRVNAAIESGDPGPHRCLLIRHRR